MSDATKSDKSAEDLFLKQPEQGLSAFLPLSNDACSFTDDCSSPFSEATVAPPDDSVLLSPPVFSAKRDEKANQKEEVNHKEAQDIMSVNFGLESQGQEELEPAIDQLLNEVGPSSEHADSDKTAEGFLDELREVCKIAADSLSAQELEQEEQKKTQDEEEIPAKESDEEPITQEVQTGAQGLLQELETLDILSELDRKKDKRSAEAKEPSEEHSVSGDLLAQLDDLSQPKQKDSDSTKDDRPKKEKKKKLQKKGRSVSPRKKLIIVASSIVGCLVFLVILFQFIGFALINGASMTPSLSEHDFIVYWKFPGEIKREEVIVSRAAGYENQMIAKRVIGLPGDIVEVDQQGRVILNGEPYAETKAIYGDTQIAGDVQFPVQVAQNCYFVLGDNRAVSVDSRVSTIGQIAEKDILGEVICWFHIE